ncbi:gem-associated protein 6 [Pelobates fuscus]|uniref:gem-associated protein 6 n=1 Tax=Pelobates fuscus TaxID=191477 RepID=UPI002FE4C926
MSEWFDKNPLEWQSYVNKQVKILAHEKNEFHGWVLTIDPVSASIVLVNFQDDQNTLIQVVMGHAVLQVDVLNEADEATKNRLTHILSPQEATSLYSTEDLETKKLNLKNWLKQNNIPVTEQGESQRTLCVAGVLTIDPPYEPGNCNSANEIILSRIQGLIEGYTSRQ